MKCFVVTEPKPREFFAADFRDRVVHHLVITIMEPIWERKFDHFVRRQLQPTAYLRYMDDLLLLNSHPERLQTWVKPIDLWLKEYRLQHLNPKKTKLVRLDQGITYLGCHAAQIGPKDQPLVSFPTGKKKWKLIQKLQSLDSLKDAPPTVQPHPLSLPLPNPNLKREIASVNSHIGSVIHTKSFQFRKKTFLRFERDINGPPVPPEIDSGQWRPYKIKNGYRSLRLR